MSIDVVGRIGGSYVALAASYVRRVGADSPLPDRSEEYLPPPGTEHGAAAARPRHGSVVMHLRR